MRGIFITFEGPDGSGKSTQIKLLARHCEELGIPVLLTREPGGTDISEDIRDLLLDPQNSEMSGVTEALLYAASRAQHVDEKIKPALEQGKVVLCDRFMDSSIAYQGYGRGLGDEVRIINEFAVQGLAPDITFFLDLPPDYGRRRLEASRDPDRLELENMSFHYRVYEAYMKLREMHPQRYISVDATSGIEKIAEEISRRFDEYVAGRA